MDVLFVIGAMLGLDGMELLPEQSEARLATLCQGGQALACDGTWRTSDGGIDPAALAAAARPLCSTTDPVACAALGVAETRTAVGGLARTAPTWDPGRAHLDEACTAGVERACTEQHRITMFLDPATSPEEVDTAPHAALAAGCARGEPTACLLSADVLEYGWGDELDRRAADQLRAQACAAGIPAACPVADAAPERLEELCGQGALPACRQILQAADTGPSARAAAVVRLERACARLDPSSCLTLAHAPERTRADRVAALARGCERSLNACLDLAEMLQSDRLAPGKLASACATGNVVACHEAGWRALRSVERSGDLRAVEDAFRRGCDGRFVPSCRALGVLQHHALTQVPSGTDGLTTLDAACTAGSRTACLAVAQAAEAVVSSTGEGAAEAAGAYRLNAAGLSSTPYSKVKFAIVSGDDVAISQGADGTATGVLELGSSEVKSVSRVPPTYPELARTLSIKATDCVVRIRMDLEGVPIAAHEVGCHPVFVRETEAAAVQWRFAVPAGMKGSLVEFDLTVKYRLR